MDNASTFLRPHSENVVASKAKITAAPFLRFKILPSNPVNNHERMIDQRKHIFHSPSKWDLITLLMETQNDPIDSEKCLEKNPIEFESSLVSLVGLRFTVQTDYIFFNMSL